MALARRLLLAAVVMVIAALPASAEAALEFNLPAQVYKEFDESGRSEVDPERCEVILFAEFPKIRNAVGYRITVTYRDGTSEDFVAPPFDLYGRGFIVRFPPPPGFGRFFLGAYSTGDGCAAADAVTEGSAVITSAKVSLDRPFRRRFRKVLKPPQKCALKEGQRRLKLGPRGAGRMIIVRRRGVVTTLEKGSQQPVNVMTNRYAGPGVIVKTGPNAIVHIAAFNGGSVLVGPGATLELTDGVLKVIDAPRPFKILDKPAVDHKVRTCNMVLSARG